MVFPNLVICADEKALYLFEATRCHNPYEYPVNRMFDISLFSVPSNRLFDQYFK